MEGRVSTRAGWFGIGPYGMSFLAIRLGFPRLSGRSPRPRAPTVAPRGAPYWVFVPNPKKWAIDRFLEQRIEQDTWGIRPSDRHRFAPGQLGIGRVGVDQEATPSERESLRASAAGIYALCEVERRHFPALARTMSSGHLDRPGVPGWPTIKIRYLRTYQENPLTIDTLRAAKPEISPPCLTGSKLPPSQSHPKIFMRLWSFLEKIPIHFPIRSIKWQSRRDDSRDREEISKREPGS